MTGNRPDEGYAYVIKGKYGGLYTVVSLGATTSSQLVDDTTPGQPPHPVNPLLNGRVR